MRLPQDRILHIDTEFKDGKVNVCVEWKGELVRCKDCRWYQDTFFNTKVNPYCVKEFDEEFGALRGGLQKIRFVHGANAKEVFQNERKPIKESVFVHHVPELLR